MSNENGRNDPARWVGSLILLAMVFYAAGDALASSVNGPEGLLTGSARNLAFGVLLMLLCSASVVAIGVLMVPVLSPHSRTVAHAYLATRTIEAILLALGGIALLAASAATVQEPSAGGALFAFGLSLNHSAYHVAMAALGLGSIPLCRVLMTSRLIPRALALWGLFGYAVFFAGSVLQIAGVDLALLHTAPGGAFELFLGGWLLFKGFSSGEPSRVMTSEVIDLVT